MKLYEYYVDKVRYVATSKDLIKLVKYKDGNRLGKRKQKVLNSLVIEKSMEDIDEMFAKLGIK